MSDNLIDNGVTMPTDNFDVDANRSLLMKCLSRFTQQWNIYSKIYYYYCGFTDTNSKMSFSSEGVFDDGIFDNFIDGEGIGNYNSVNDRFHGRVNTNFIKRLIQEEVSYSVGNPITYTSIAGDTKIIQALKDGVIHFKADHETKLAMNMLLYSTAYELYYIDSTPRFCAKVISPRHGFAYMDNAGNVIFFLHAFRQKFDPKLYIDVYTQNEIIHCDSVFTVISRQPHCFGQVPIGIAQCSEEGWLDSIYHDVKSLQDAFETNVSDISSEITDNLRNAYLHINNFDIKDEDLKNMKKNGIIATKGDNISAQFLVKNINDTFIQNTLSTLEDKIFYITAHINPTEKLPSNTSSLAIKARMMGLETKCKLNQSALTNCIRSRIQMLFIYLNSLKSTDYDYLDIKTKFVPNLPSDDLMVATMAGLLNGKVSNETMNAQLSFIDDPLNEAKKMKAQNKADSVGNALLNPPTDTPPSEPMSNMDMSNAPTKMPNMNMSKIA